MKTFVCQVLLSMCLLIGKSLCEFFKYEEIDILSSSWTPKSSTNAR
jgi:hypothetical protein